MPTLICTPTAPFGGGLIQFTVGADTLDPDTRIVIDSGPLPYYSPTIASDSRIYMRRGPSGDRLSGIKYPNAEGLACEFMDTAVILPVSLTGTNIAMPNFPASYYRRLPGWFKK